MEITEEWIDLNKKRIFEPGDHLIFFSADQINSIEVPEGYELIYQDKILQKVDFNYKLVSRYFFINNKKVEATLYKNKNTKEVSYYFPGSIVKENSIKHKVLKKS